MICFDCVYVAVLLSVNTFFYIFFFFFKQKTAYEMRISDWSSDVCSSDLKGSATIDGKAYGAGELRIQREDTPMGAIIAGESGVEQIGRASCRERVCQYV